jgi:hypothetical protein
LWKNGNICDTTVSQLARVLTLEGMTKSNKVMELRTKHENTLDVSNRDYNVCMWIDLQI